MSAPSKNTQKALSHALIEAAFDALTALTAEMKDQEDHAAKVRQTQLDYDQINASTYASLGHSTETLNELPQTPPRRYRTVASAQAETPTSNTSLTGQPDRFSTATRAEIKDQGDHAAKVRQIQLEYEHMNASTYASLGHSTETIDELPQTPPPRYRTVSSAQVESPINNTASTDQPDRFSTASRADLTAHDEHAAKVRQIEYQYNKQNTSTNASVENLQEIVSHPPHQPSHRDPDEYLKMLARASELLPEVYCTCRGRAAGAMVECTNAENCAIGWYHAACIDMKVLPGPKVDWFCPHCREHKVGKATAPEAPLPTPQHKRRLVMWTEMEGDAMRRVVGELTTQGVVMGMQGFEEVAKRLASGGFQRRSAASVKAWWLRNKGGSEAGEGGVVAGPAGVSEKARGKMRAVEEDEEDDGDGEELMEEEDNEDE